MNYYYFASIASLPISIIGFYSLPLYFSQRSQRGSDAAIFASLRSLREISCSIELRNVAVSDPSEPDAAQQTPIVAT